jgi:hypothetical protein
LEELKYLLKRVLSPGMYLHVLPSFLPSFPSALQLRMRFSFLSISLHSSLLFIFPSFHFHFTEIIMYILQPFADVDFCSIRLVSEQFRFYSEVVSLTPNPKPGEPGYPSSSGSYPLTCPAWVALPVATLPLA